MGGWTGRRAASSRDGRAADAGMGARGQGRTRDSQEASAGLRTEQAAPLGGAKGQTHGLLLDGREHSLWSRETAHTVDGDGSRCGRLVQASED